MPLLTFDDHDPADVARGSLAPPVQAGTLEIFVNSLHKGNGSADVHTHDHEQVGYVVSGRLKVIEGDDEYEVGPGEASLHPAGQEHWLVALEDTVCLVIHGPAS